MSVLAALAPVVGVAHGDETETTTELQDYRDVDGVKVPFTTHVVTPVQAVTISLQKVENNKPIDDALFAKPAVK